METQDLLLAALGIALGGFIKGATGAGAPVVGVPILAIVVGVPHAVAVFALLNLFSNIWQAWAYREAVGDRRFVRGFSIAGGIGAAAGTMLLAWLSTNLLLAGLATVVFLYIASRTLRPEWQMSRSQGNNLAVAVGLAGGLMQGAGGISAPVSVTFLNAMRLERDEFIGTISIFFIMMSVTQVPTLIWFGILDWERTGLAVAAAIPLFGAMPLGEAAARHVSKGTFDKVIQFLLFLVALRLVYMATT